MAHFFHHWQQPSIDNRNSYLILLPNSELRNSRKLLPALWREHPDDKNIFQQWRSARCWGWRGGGKPCWRRHQERRQRTLWGSFPSNTKTNNLILVISIPGCLCFRQLPENVIPCSHISCCTKHLHIMLYYLLQFVQIGDDEGEEEPSDHRKKHKKSSHHHPHSHRYLLLIFRSASFSGNCSDLWLTQRNLSYLPKENPQGTLQRPLPCWFWPLIQACH